MDKDLSQMNHHGLLHHEKTPDDSSQLHVSSLVEPESRTQEADLDALEAKLFAMAGSRC